MMTVPCVCVCLGGVGAADAFAANNRLITDCERSYVAMRFSNTVGKFRLIIVRVLCMSLCVRLFLGAGIVSHL